MAPKAPKPDTELPPDAATDAPEGNDTPQANVDQPEASTDPANEGNDTLQANADQPGAPTDPLPADPFGIGTVMDTRYFPSPLLATGHRARRASWAPGYELLVASAGGRSGQKLRLMIMGGRSGQIEWKPQNMADELMADDWQAILVEPTMVAGTDHAIGA